jgi:hypothetical protein
VPGTTTTIDRNQRKGLYELVRNHLGSIEDFFVALERTKDFARAEQLAVEFAEDFRLLHDIGWAERETFEVLSQRGESRGAVSVRGMRPGAVRSRRRPSADEMRGLRPGNRARQSPRRSGFHQPPSATA